LGTLVELMLGVGGAVALISIAAGVQGRIDNLVSVPVVRQSGVLDVGQIEAILRALTTSVLLITLINLTFTAIVLGQMVMRARANEIAIRKDKGAEPADLMREFMRDALLLAITGSLLGETCGLATAWGLNAWTPLPTVITPVATWLVLPIAVAATLVANYIPARAAARMSPRDFFSRRA
jgi:ABC-type antimicrobial peptide transport system permease subunit